jgi:hypothetical protein
VAVEGFRLYIRDEDAEIIHNGSAWVAAASTAYNAENARDDIGAALVAGDGLTKTIDDAGDTITIDCDLGPINVGTPGNGEVLTWDNAAGEWISAPAPGSGGGAGGTVPNGGTTGQVLTKLSGVDQDVGWRGFRGALVKKAADQTAANYTAGVKIAWDAEEFDTNTIHDNVTNNTRLTVPTGASKVRLSATVASSLDTLDTWKLLQIAKNGSVDWVGAGGTTHDVGASGPTVSCHSAIVNVTPGDYFEVHYQTESDTSITILATRSWFQMQIIE